MTSTRRVPVRLGDATAAVTTGGWLSTLVVWWACCAPNRLADRAGRYRRLALGLAAVPIPLALIGTETLAGGTEPNAAVVHFVVALLCSWSAGDLVWRGSLLDRRGLPAPSAVALVACLVLLVVVSPSPVGVSYGPRPAVASAVGLLVVGLVALMVAEHRRLDLAAMTGRVLVIGGLAVLGGAVAVRGASVLDASLVMTASRVGLAAVLWVTAFCEARTLSRGIALALALARR